MSAISSSTTTTTTNNKKNALIVVDMSVEQVDGITYEKDTLIANCKKLMSSSNDIFDLKIDSRLWLTSPDESSLSWVWDGTATDLFVAGSEGASLIPQLRHRDDVTFCIKNNYSSFANANVLNILKQNSITDVYICGINTDYCIFATALDSFYNHFRTYVVVDAVSSCRGKSAHEEGIQNIIRHFSDSALVTTQRVLENTTKTAASK